MAAAAFEPGNAQAAMATVAPAMKARPIWPCYSNGSVGAAPLQTAVSRRHLLAGLGALAALAMSPRLHNRTGEAFSSSATAEDWLDDQPLYLVWSSSDVYQGGNELAMELSGAVGTTPLSLTGTGVTNSNDIYYSGNFGSWPITGTISYKDDNDDSFLATGTVLGQQVRLECPSQSTALSGDVPFKLSGSIGGEKLELTLPPGPPMAVLGGTLGEASFLYKFVIPSFDTKCTNPAQQTEQCASFLVAGEFTSGGRTAKFDIGLMGADSMSGTYSGPPLVLVLLMAWYLAFGLQGGA